MRALFKVLLSSFTTIAVAGPALAQSNTPPALQYAKQGWTADDRQTFYTTSQGSHIIRYLWFKALRRLDVDEPFAGDQLARYGYLSNEKSRSNPESLPVGFVIDGDVGTGDLGMSCAACHTGQIEYQKDGVTQRLRIDGAPAMADFQAFLKDLTEVATATLNDDGRFDKFAHAVLGNRYSATRAKDLKAEFVKWVDQWTAFMNKSLPTSPWGPGRLDAFGMIFNRVAGKDLKIDANFQVADAPVSYPFLWNAAHQDKTQWNGGVPNGLNIHALGRNTGEVFGVFAEFGPVPVINLPGVPPLIDYGKNSVNFGNLQQLEEKIAALQPPPWPFALDQALVEKGRVLFEAHCSKGCHEQTESKDVPGAWLTPVLPAGTDPKMFENADRSSQSGLLEGALIPNTPGLVLAETAKTHDILANAVVGSLINDALPFAKLPNLKSGVFLAVQKDLPILLNKPQNAPLSALLKNPAVIATLRSQIERRFTNMYKSPNNDASAAYETRVLKGIWATAPYLHNGSVPNLWELLLPPERRSTSFMIGSRTYDEKNVGYVTTESPFKYGTLTVGQGAQPGNSNAGHDYSRDMTDDDRWALLEYLKQL